MKKKSPMTIEKLARIVTTGFTEGKKQFEKIDSKFEKINTRFDKVDKRFGQIDIKLEKLDVKIDHEIANLATAVKTGFDHVEEQLTDINTSLAESQNKTNGRLQHLGNRLDAFVTHERRITRLEKKVGIPTAD